MSEPLVSVLTALGDDELILGHRHSEWTGFAPHIEEDVAFSSIAQDEIGHAAAYYSLAAKITEDDPNRIAFGRSADDYRNAIICERENVDWGYTLARHWLYDHADAIRLESLEGSSDEGLAALATKIRREERYHLLHADTWMKRVAQGPVEGRKRLADCVAQAFHEATALFEPFEVEDGALAEGWLPSPSSDLRRLFVERMTRELDALGLPTEMTRDTEEGAEFVASSSGDLIATDGRERPQELSEDGAGGRRGRRSEAFAALWDEMTSMYRTDPGASW